MPTNGLPSIIDRPDAALAPGTTDPPAGNAYTSLAQALDGGIPVRLALDSTRILLLAVPLGQARRWLDDDPRNVVVDTSAAGPLPDPAVLRSLDAPQARLTLLESGAVGDTVPVTTGEPAVLTMAGRAVVEIVVDSLVATVGSLRSPGQYGSSISLRWRDLHAAPNDGPAQVVLDPTIPRARRHWFLLRRQG